MMLEKCNFVKYLQILALSITEALLDNCQDEEGTHSQFKQQMIEEFLVEDSKDTGLWAWGI